MFSKKLVLVLIVIVVVLVASGIWLGSWVLSLSKPNPSGPSEYSAVYVATGDIYYGKLEWFPLPHLKNVWLLQRTAGPSGQQLGIVPFPSAFWGPMDEVYLNPRQIIFWTRLRNDSQVAKAFQNPAILQQSQASPPPPSNFQGPTSPPPNPQQSKPGR